MTKKVILVQRDGKWVAAEQVAKAAGKTIVKINGETFSVPDNEVQR